MPGTVQTLPQQRIYFVEFLRIFLILSVFLFHIGEIDVNFRNSAMALLRTRGWRPWFAVEPFFIIGGFFLYRRIARNSGTLPCDTHTLSQPSMLEHVGKLWMRLMPGFTFCYILLVLVGVKDWWNFPLCFLPVDYSIGITNYTLINFGGWFVGVYFILNILFICLFHISRKSAWLWICTLALMCWCIQMNVKPEKGIGFGGMYYGVLSQGMVRGFTCMSLGMVASYLSDVWNFRERLSLRIIATVYEILAILMLFRYMYRPAHVRYSPIVVEFVVAMLLVSAAHSWGYFTKFLNGFSRVIRVSRYTYSLLLSQATLCTFFAFNHKFHLPHPTLSLLILGSAIPLTLLEYHFVERWAVPKLKLYFQHARKTEFYEKIIFDHCKKIISNCVGEDVNNVGNKEFPIHRSEGLGDIPISMNGLPSLKRKLKRIRFRLLYTFGAKRVKLKMRRAELKRQLKNVRAAAQKL